MKAKLDERFSYSEADNSDLTENGYRPPKRQKISTEYSLSIIPNDVWKGICGLVKFQDLKNLRLTCHWFREKVLIPPLWNPWISYPNLDLYSKKINQYHKVDHHSTNGYNGNGNSILPSLSPLIINQLYFPSTIDLSGQTLGSIPSFIQIVDFLECGHQSLKEENISLLPSSLQTIILPYWTDKIRENEILFLLSTFPNLQIQFRDKLGTYSILFWCCSKGYKSILEYLFEHNRDVETINNLYYVSQETALISATWNGFKDIVKLLLTKQVNINIQRRTDKRTALMIASILGYDQIVNLLVDSNAQVSLKDDTGKTAYDLASDEFVQRILQDLVD